MDVRDEPRADQDDSGSTHSVESYNADVRMPTRCARTSGPPRCSNPGRRHCTRPARAISPHNAAEPLLTSMAGTPEEGRNSEWRDPHDPDARVAERLLS